MKNRIILITLALAVAAVFVLRESDFQASAPSPESSTIDEPAAATPDEEPSPAVVGETVVPPASDNPEARIPRLVSLGAGECIPCRRMKPIREELERQYEGTLEVVFHDVWQDPTPGYRYGIRGIPTLIFFDADGVELGRYEGFMAKKAILDRFEEWGVRLEQTNV